ncbi:MAG: 30S ribosomal protein S6 [Pirellulales bacterium]
MSQQVYDGTFIFDSNRYGKDPNGVSGQIDSLIESLGGEVLVSRMWEERRLAYPINNQRKGTYWLTYFRLESTKIPELNQTVGRNDNVLRHLVLRVDPRIVDALVAHAKGETLEQPEEEEQPEEVAAT